jgi:hypothetical protein
MNNEEIALAALYNNPLYSEIKGLEIDRKIDILRTALNIDRVILGDITEEDDKLVTLSGLEEIYLDQIGYRKTESDYYD